MSRHAWSIPRLWPGETVVILAGGPSLDLAQIRHVAMARLEERCRVIAVNDAVFPAWWADWLHACDVKWWTWHRNTATKFKGIKTTTTETVPVAWGVRLLRIGGDTGGQAGGWSERRNTIYPGGNGGYQAIQCAMKAAAARVLLLGFDMRRPKDGPGHFFGEHPDGMRSDYEDTMLPWFDTLLEPARDMGVEIINCAPGSAIECFPRANVEEIL